jgi:hypothetical protein
MCRETLNLPYSCFKANTDRDYLEQNFPKEEPERIGFNSLRIVASKIIFDIHKTVGVGRYEQ